MSIDTTHDTVKRYEPMWVRIADAVEGEDAIKEKGQTYLPSLEGAEPREYDAYKNRAEFFAATGRTVGGLVGMIRRKDPQISWPESRKDILKRITSRGDSIDEMIGTVLRALASVGRIGCLVDAPSRPNAEPFVAIYRAVDIRAWETAEVNGRTVPIRIHLRETFKVPDPNDKPFGRKTKTRYRILRLGLNVPTEGGQADVTQAELDASNEGDLKYWQETYVESESATKGAKGNFVFERIIQPFKNGGNAWNHIPFVAANSINTNIEPTKPPIIDLVNTNLSHYRNSADYEHGLHLTALPTPWAAGFSLEEGELGGKKKELRMGALSAWTTENHEAKAGMLEFQGTGLKAIADAMEAKQKRMAVLGGRLLEDQKKAQEAAETVKIRLSGDHATLADISVSASDGLTQVFMLLAEWMGISDDVGIELTRDFQTAGIPSDKITALMGAMQAGAISWQTFFWNLQQGEAIPDGISEEDEAARILEGIPGGQPPTAPPTDEEIEEEEPEGEEEEEEV